MKLLLFCPHFRPDLHAATGEVMTQMVDALAHRGHRISVVTSLPWYRGHRVEEAWRGRPWRRETTPWGEIIRVWPFPTDKTNVPARVLGFGGMTALAAALGLTAGRPDVVMAMSPPPFLGDAAWLAARRWGVPLVVNVQDIFPDVAVELGALTNDRVLRLARAHERSLYRRADAITVLSDDQARNVRAKLVDPGAGAGAGSGVGAGSDLGSVSGRSATPVEVIHNFVDLQRIRPGERDNDYRRRHDLVGRTVVMYSGNVGLSQSFDLMREAADRWRGRTSAGGDVVFVINGEGAARPAVEGWAAERDNVRVVDFGPRSEVPSILAAADLHLILLRGGLARSSTPSKLYSILAAGRPVLASIDEGSEVAAVVKEVEIGAAVPPDDPWAFCQALDQLLADPDELAAMGRRARAHATSCPTAAAQSQAYEELFERLQFDSAGEAVR